MSPPTPPETHTADQTDVCIVDDDDAMRRGMEFLIKAGGYDVCSFPSAQAYLDADPIPQPRCLLLDIRMPGISGLELLEQLRSRDDQTPVIFVTAYGNIPTAVRAVKIGAFDFIEKPFDGSELLDRVRRAIAHGRRMQIDRRQTDDVRRHLQSLTPREREVLELVVSGMLNKQVAGELGISIKTVENHRARVMEKLHAANTAELVRLVVSVDPDI